MFHFFLWLEPMPGTFYYFMADGPTFGDLIPMFAGGLCPHFTPWRGNGDRLRRSGSRDADLSGEFSYEIVYFILKVLFLGLFRGLK